MCTILEAKHSLFKNKKWRNFKCLPLSIALHHQRWMCLRQCGYAGEKSHVYLYAGDEVSSGCEVVFHNLPLVIGEKMQMQSQEDLIPPTVLRHQMLSLRESVMKMVACLYIVTLRKKEQRGGQH